MHGSGPSSSRRLNDHRFDFDPLHGDFKEGSWGRGGGERNSIHFRSRFDWNWNERTNELPQKSHSLHFLASFPTLTIFMNPSAPPPAAAAAAAASWSSKKAYEDSADSNFGRTEVGTFTFASSSREETFDFGSPSFVLKFPRKKEVGCVDEEEEEEEEQQHCSASIAAAEVSSNVNGYPMNGRTVQLRRKPVLRSLSAEVEPLTQSRNCSEEMVRRGDGNGCNDENLVLPMFTNDDEGDNMSMLLSYEYDQSCQSLSQLSFNEEAFLTPEIKLGRKLVKTTPHLPCLSGDGGSVSKSLDFGISHAQNDSDDRVVMESSVDQERNPSNRAKSKKGPNIMIRKGNFANLPQSKAFVI